MDISEKTQSEWFVSHIKVMLDELMEQDEDGDFPITGKTCRGWVRPVCEGAWGVQVAVVAAVDVPDRVAVLREMNEINMSDPLVKLVRPHHEGWIVATSFVLAEGLTGVNLRELIQRTMAVADSAGPMLATVHGGSTPVPVTWHETDSDA